MSEFVVLWHGKSLATPQVVAWCMGDDIFLVLQSNDNGIAPPGAQFCLFGRFLGCEAWLCVWGWVLQHLVSNFAVMWHGKYLGTPQVVAWWMGAAGLLCSFG